MRVGVSGALCQGGRDGGGCRKGKRSGKALWEIRGYEFKEVLEYGNKSIVT